MFMHRFKITKTICALGVVMALGACDKAEEQLGLAKAAPDEFAVVKRAPLELPPSYSLRPPRPGAPRPQEQETVEQARVAVFGGEQPAQAAPAGADGALLQNAGASVADPNIRNTVDEESAELVDENQPVVDKLLSLGSDEGPAATVVDAKAEAERLKANKEAGKPVTAGETPSRE